MYLGNIPSLGEVYLGLFTSGGLNPITLQPLNEKGVKVVLPNSLKYLGDNTFVNTMLKEIDLPNNLEYIGNRVFAINPYLIEISIPSTVETIGVSVFTGDENLETLTFEENSSLTIMEQGAFEYCALDYQNEDSPLYLIKTITTMGELVFDNNPNLKYIYYEGDTTGFGIS